MRKFGLDIKARIDTIFDSRFHNPEGQNMKIKIIAIVSLLSLTACSGMSYALDNYSGVDVQKTSYMGQEFRVFDKPEEQRLMITPSVGRAITQGATFGAAATAEMTYQMAAQSFLDLSGRDCTVGDMKLVVQPQFETFYSCN